MKKLIFILPLAFLITCSGPIQTSWNNFRAHYNTHYNAKKSFEAGLKQVEKQPVAVNPDRPVRVHQEPNKAGDQYFAETIEKEAQLLRKFPSTRWTDDALFLIGKSYYYRKEFYLALQKFEELYALNPDPQLKQRAAIWKGRTLLDLGRHLDAILYLENELANLNDIWSPSLKAEIQVLLAEHYARVSNWESAADYLNHSVHAIRDKPFLGRTFFLYGQVLEQRKRYGEAFFSYDRVSSGFPNYEYIYWAEIKKGRMARREGNTDLALSVFSSMKNDDKNFERQSELDFEIARTQEVKGNIDIAEQIYDRMLHAGISPLSRDLQAKVYYRLGKIYSEEYQNYEAAAAYFDSSSIQVGNTNFASDGESAGVLASAYGSYASLRREISKTDSLLWLGSLPASELDSVIEMARKRKQRELQQQFSNKERTSADRILINADEGRTVREDQGSSRHGFLNYRNQNLVADSKSKFRVVWGGRPLMDNWRRIEAVTGVIPVFRGEEQEEVQPSERIDAGREEQHDVQLDIDLSEIPATEEEKRGLLKERAEIQYKLGSLFFLTLDLPDSAAFYFRQVIKDRSGGELEVKSMYSLFELHHLLQQEDRSMFWGKRILQDYPNTVYAIRVRQRMDAGSDIPSGTDPDDTLLAEVQAIESTEDSMSLTDRAERFRILALDNRSSKIAPYIYYRAIRDYVRLAKEYSDSSRYEQFWQSGASDILLNDSPDIGTGMEGDLRTGPKPLFSGAYWDSVRTMVEEYDAAFTAAPHRKQLRELERVLAEHVNKEAGLKTCREPEVTPEIRPGMDAFLDWVKIPKSMENMDLPKKITYRLIIKNDGNVVSYQLESESDLPDLEKAYERAIEKHLQFFPFEGQQNFSEIHCIVSFPVRRR